MTTQQPFDEVETLANCAFLSPGDTEKEYLLNTLSNRDTLRTPEPELLHARFEGHARKSPEVAAIDWNSIDKVLYSELNAKANQLAHHLIANGTEVGEIVPLILDKSIDTVVAILGVMKAGAAYVPLGPENPVERNSFIIKEVAAKVVILHSAYVDNFKLDSVTAIVMDELQLSEMTRDPPKTSVTPEDLAYVIYTSGSTGQPKGVKIPHRAAASAVRSMEIAEHRHTGEWRTLQFANYVFDASVQDIFNTLSSCGTLCMAPTDALLSNPSGLINEMNVKEAIVTPTVAKLLSPEETPTLKTLIVGGEPLANEVVDTWAPDHQLLNVYGPTETSMVVTTKEVEKGDPTFDIGTYMDKQNFTHDCIHQCRHRIACSEFNTGS